MKRILPFVALILPLGILFAQNEGLDKYPVDISERGEFTARQVGYMAVFPGCENVDENDKEKLQQCMSVKLNEQLSNELGYFANEMEKKGYTKAVAKVQFIVDKQGKIIKVEAVNGGNVDLGIAAENALKKIASKIKKIKPALLADGTPVNLIFQIPIRYQINASFLDEFVWNEMTLATLQNENSKYEIRQDKEKNIKAYEIANGKETFLGKFNSTQEVFQSEPYKSLLAQNKNRILLAENTVKKELYRLYYSSEKPEYIDAYKVVNGNEEFIETFHQSEIEGYRIYLQVVLRN